MANASILIFSKEIEADVTLEVRRDIVDLSRPIIDVVRTTPAPNGQSAIAQLRLSPAAARDLISQLKDILDYR